MTGPLGMDPARVEALAARLHAQDARLSQVASYADRAASASTSPWAWGIQPGDPVIAPYSVHQVRNAAIQIRQALSAADELIGRLLTESAQQTDASKPDGSRPPTVPQTEGEDGGEPTSADPARPMFTPPSLASDLGLGVAAETLTRYRGRLIVPGANAAIPTVLLSPQARDAGWPREYVKGKWYSINPTTGLRAPVGSWGYNPLPPSATKPSGWNNRLVFTPNTNLGAPPAWAKWGARGLGVLGAGVTYWGTYTESYNVNLERHPEWTESQRTERAWVDTGIVGTASVAAGAGGAWAGAKGGALLGAAIGSVFPGPGTVIGGVVGGILGGVIGAWAGSTAGSAAATGISDAVRGES